MSNGKFLVDISALNLGDDALERIGDRLRGVVLGHIAEIPSAITSRLVIDPGRTDGMHVRPYLGTLDSSRADRPAMSAMYGVVIQEAILSNDTTRMSAVREQAEEYLSQAQAIKKELVVLRKALKSKKK